MKIRPASIADALKKLAKAIERRARVNAILLAHALTTSNLIDPSAAGGTLPTIRYSPSADPSPLTLMISPT
jgi:hypothetical protein